MPSVVLLCGACADCKVDLLYCVIIADALEESSAEVESLPAHTWVDLELIDVRDVMSGG